MKNLINNITVTKLKELTLIIFLITVSVCIANVAIDMHEQSLLDRKFGKLLIKEKELQLNTVYDTCEH